MADPTESKTPPTIVQPTPAPAPTPVTAAPPASATPAPAPLPVAPPAPPAAHTLGEDGDIPDNADLIQMPKSALAKRLERHTRKELKERFGTDNPEEIKAQLEELKTFKAQQEEQRLAGLSEAERLKEQLAQERARGDRYKQKHQQTVDQHVYSRENGRIEGIADQHIDPQFKEYALQNLARHLTSTYSERELKDLPDEKIQEWFRGEVSRNPKLARDFTGAPPPPPPRQVPLNNGIGDPARPNPPPGQAGEVTFSPSAPNALTREQARAEARRLGYDY